MPFTDMSLLLAIGKTNMNCIVYFKLKNVKTTFCNDDVTLTLY